MQLLPVMTDRRRWHPCWCGDKEEEEEHSSSSGGGGGGGGGGSAVLGSGYFVAASVRSAINSMGGRVDAHSQSTRAAGR